MMRGVMWLRSEIVEELKRPMLTNVVLIDMQLRKNLIPFAMLYY